ncbi:MAG: hypothetical protein KA383_14330 [Phycisphaerae bacterium]|nr:hypothetical protein [Phycisphaerae bacterium]
MSQVTGINFGGVPPVRRVSVATEPPEQVTPADTPDVFEITGMTVTDALATLDDPRIAEIRRQIESGTYLTEHKLEVVYERLTDLLIRSQAQLRRASA